MGTNFLLVNVAILLVVLVIVCLFAAFVIEPHDKLIIVALYLSLVALFPLIELAARERNRRRG